jgi:hypothetical protein
MKSLCNVDRKSHDALFVGNWLIACIEMSMVYHSQCLWVPILNFYGFLLSMYMGCFFKWVSGLGSDQIE